MISYKDNSIIDEKCINVIDKYSTSIRFFYKNTPGECSKWEFDTYEK